MPQKAIRLTDVPAAGTDLEDYVAALFHASGYYVEKSLVERDPDDVLELDIVATRYTEKHPDSIIVEAKGGKWGYTDIFKVVGWMRYLHQARGAFFVVRDQSKDVGRVKLRSSRMGVSFVHLDDFARASQIFEEAELGSPSSSAVVNLWRFSSMVERKLVKNIHSDIKVRPEAIGPTEILRYHRLVNDGIFFTETHVETLEMLYGAYKDHPKLTLAAAQELQNGTYDPNPALEQNALIREALIQGNHNILQSSLYAEHRARLAILRAAVNLCCTYPGGYESSLESGSDEWNAYWLLPQTFREALTWLSAQRNFHLYALFWQQFLWGWGGFYLRHIQETEFEWMSKYSGLPSADIPSALETFDRFFPMGKSSWITESNYTDIVQVKLMPMAFQGIGAHQRRQEYDDAKLEKIGGIGYTVTNMKRWINLTVDFLGGIYIEEPDELA
ncbi:restriction endonuclease [Amycolatopsis mongoliensis]|uniref:Restriction endonuclease n=1 Tax=Amycolatopsis mongoliensis TaxID=715475 RepID=A0A9Y2JPR7_9PSEU|nr:restriction endonuclease [Amycolatopsis sp. 4-36]WIY01254.1 restriction endonuclease [Amycolatopsis sp. 4-36]